ncbi:site-specific integrase [Polynucleobacter wuianus]|uniref:tyrosine-type recombinase/integrase n=1 Tax=Polynucleobacter wuianus TaxID=1743168 RepID=UPI001C0E3BF9|nr:site-specific integrase [Polynucleobacter wuianus]MBU3609047.1 site-specific integrase [Polynucleobacter wuianus]
MPLKKQTFTADEIEIYDEAVVYKRGEYWQMRMWLGKEKKYARFSLRTRNRNTAIDKAKKYYHELMAQQLAGKTYFSKTTKQGVEEYLKQRALDVEAELIVKGRYGTIKTHLEHWLDFIGRDTKLKELERTDCENYLHSRTKTKKKINVSQTTVANEQSTINAMLSWLYRRNETYIEAFDFKPLKRIDRGDEALRRSTFTDEEVIVVKQELEKYITEAKRNVDEEGNMSKVINGYYLLISIITGLRRGEQLQLKWSDIKWLEKNVKGQAEDDIYSLVKITVRAETTKVRKTRRFVVKDWEYFDELFKLLQPRYVKANKENKKIKAFGDTFVFSVNGMSMLTPRAIGYHFDKMIELAEIKDTETRDLVPYSFRHYFITDRINRGATPTQVAETCGTSTAQIEKTYYHTSEAKMITNALPQFEYKDGLLIPK